MANTQIKIQPIVGSPIMLSLAESEATELLDTWDALLGQAFPRSLRVTDAQGQVVLINPKLIATLTVTHLYDTSQA